MYTKLMKSIDAKGIEAPIFCQYKGMIFSCCHLGTLMNHQAFYQSWNLRQMKKTSPSMFQATSLSLLEGSLSRTQAKSPSKGLFYVFLLILCLLRHLVIILLLRYRFLWRNESSLNILQSSVAFPAIISHWRLTK